MELAKIQLIANGDKVADLFLDNLIVGESLPRMLE